MEKSGVLSFSLREATKSCALILDDEDGGLAVPESLSLDLEYLGVGPLLSSRVLKSRRARSASGDGGLVVLATLSLEVEPLGVASFLPSNASSSLSLELVVTAWGTAGGSARIVEASDGACEVERELYFEAKVFILPAQVERKVELFVSRSRIAFNS